MLPQENTIPEFSLVPFLVSLWHAHKPATIPSIISPSKSPCLAKLTHHFPRFSIFSNRATELPYVSMGFHISYSFPFFFSMISFMCSHGFPIFICNFPWCSYISCYFLMVFLLLCGPHRPTFKRVNVRPRLVDLPRSNGQHPKPHPGDANTG